MKIGIISDTHDLVRPEVFNVFDGVDLILHAGDIGSEDVLIELRTIAPVTAVLGNNDMHMHPRYKETATFELEERTFCLQHIFRDIPQAGELSVADVSKVFVFGHSHKPVNEQVGETLYFNPGSAGPRRFKLPVTVGTMALYPNRIEAEIIDLLS